MSLTKIQVKIATKKYILYDLYNILYFFEIKPLIKLGNKLLRNICVDILLYSQAIKNIIS